MDASVLEILTTLGAGSIIGLLVKEIIGWIRGRQANEQSAWEQRDREAKARRMLEEYAHELRHELTDLGLDPDDLPTWPSYGTKGRPNTKE